MRIRTWVVTVVLIGAAVASAQPRVKDIASVKGVRSNPLFGVGLVVGLAGTGGGDLTEAMMRNLMGRLRIAPESLKLNGKNTSAVIVTATLPPFAAKGSRIDVTVSALGKTTSLRGGILLMTPLTGPDGKVYAVAQGAVSVGGFGFSGAAATVQKGHPTVGRIPGGAVVEAEVPTTFLHDNSFTLVLYDEDFSTAAEMARRINENFKGVEATVVDAGNVSVKIDPAMGRSDVMALMDRILRLEVTTDAPAVVVINERTGTVVAGENVSISSVAISHGTLTVITKELPRVSQPSALGRGQTVVVPRTNINIIEKPLKKGGLTVLQKTTTVSEVARALNMLGATPADIIAIFQALKEAGALHARLKIM